MKLFGTLSELVAIVFRKDTRAITIRPNQATTYLASTDVQLAPTADTTQTLVEIDATQTLTNKTLTAPTLANPTVTDGSFTSVDTFSLDDTDSAFNTELKSTSTNTANRVLTLDVDDGSRTLELSGDLRVVGGFSTTLTETGATNVTLPTTGTLATLAGTEVFTNKDIDGGTAANTRRITVPKDTLANLTALTRKEGTIVYATDTDKFYSDDGSNLFEVGSGSGSGELNEVLNPSAASTTTGWTNGTSHTGSRVTTGSPLDPLIATAFSVVASAATAESSTSGFYYPIATIATALKSKKLKVELYVVVPAADVWRLSVYQGTTRLALSTDSSGATTLPAGFTGKFTAYFDTTTATAYSVNLTKTTRAGAGNDLTFTNIVVGPGIQPQGAVVGEWISFTPSSTGTWTTNTTWTGRYRRVGDSMEIRWRALMAGSPGAVSLFANIPTGFTIDTTKMVNPQDGISETLGLMWMRDAGTAGYSGHLQYHNTTSLQVRYWDDNASGIFDSAVTNTAPIAAIASGDELDLTATVPIAEWSGSGTVNVAQNDVEYAYNTSTSDADDTTAFGYGPSGTTFPGAQTAAHNKRVRFQTPIQTTDQLVLEIQAAAGTSQWVEVTGDPTTGTAPYQFQNTNTYGMGVGTVSINSTDVDVKFGQYKFPNGATYASAGAAWATGGGNWRLKKVKSGQAVGFGEVGQNTSGLVKSAGQLKGTNTNDSATAGYVGEVVRSDRLRSAAVGLTSGATANIVSIVLTAGDWNISGVLGTQATGTTSISSHLYGVTATSATLPSGNDSFAVPNASGEVRLQYATPAQIPANDTTHVVASYQISLSATTTFYLYTNSTFTASTLNGYGMLQARRMR